MLEEASEHHVLRRARLCLKKYQNTVSSDGSDEGGGDAGDCEGAR